MTVSFLPFINAIPQMMINIICIIQENEPTLRDRKKQSDAREIQNFYYDYYKQYIQALQNAADKADRLALLSFSFLNMTTI